MREIEVKAQVRSPQTVLAELAKRGVVFDEPLSQVDTVYTTADWAELLPTERNVLRIRRQPDRTLLTLKRDIAGELDCLEKETEVSDAKAAEEILGLMGYHESVRVEKLRRRARYGELEICLDEVAGLGTFIEVERLVEESAGPDESLWSFLRELGVDDADRVTKGYDTLVKEAGAHRD